MRALVVAVALLCLPSSAVAQQSTPKQAKHQSGTTKMWIGLGLVVVGGSMAATSHQSASTSVAGVGTFEASATNTGQLIVGLAMAGGGGYLLWNGLNERKEADNMPSTRFFVATGKKTLSGFIRRTW